LATTAPCLAAQASSADKAAAEALFNEAIDLVGAGQLREGCSKLEASQLLDPALGTTLRLADCYERVGRSASAWALFKEAQGMARRSGEAEREAIATERADALFPRLAYLLIKLDGAMPEGLLVERNGAGVPLSSLGTPLPVDPGPVEVMATAPQHQSWSVKVDVASGPGTQAVLIPSLLLLPAAPALPVAAPVPLAPRPAAPDSPPPRAQRLLGVGLSSLGAVSLLTGAGLGWFAMRDNDRSKQARYCPTDNHNGCTSEGLALRERAHDLAQASSIVSIAGGVALVAGIVLWSTAPSAKPRDTRSALRWQASGSAGSFRTTLEGSW
jgi:serine/threonine-protein kinase